jgi:hypothetical protein
MAKTPGQIRAIYADLRSSPKYKKRVEKEKNKVIPRKAKHKKVEEDSINEGPPNRVMAKELSRKKAVKDQRSFRTDVEARQFIKDNGGKGKVSTFKLGPKNKPIIKYNATVYEDAPVNATGAAVPGTGDTGEVFKKGPMVRRKKFAGNECFVVNNETYSKCIQGKKAFKHWKTYVGECDTGSAIREYARTNRDAPIVVQDERTGAMCYLRYGKKK